MNIIIINNMRFTIKGNKNDKTQNNSTLSRIDYGSYQS